MEYVKIDVESMMSPGEWSHACDSYGKVQHSRKACVYSNYTTPKGERIEHLASRVPNWADARLFAAAKDMYIVLKYMNHVTDGGYCICPRLDGNSSDEKHATICVDARKALRKVEGTYIPR